MGFFELLFEMPCILNFRYELENRDEKMYTIKGYCLILSPD